MCSSCWMEDIPSQWFIPHSFTQPHKGESAWTRPVHISSSECSIAQIIWEVLPRITVLCSQVTVRTFAGSKGKNNFQERIKKVFCFELRKFPDFMLVISSFLTIYLDFNRLHLGQGKKNRVGASLKTFSSSTQPTKEETLAWWNELEDRHFTGCAALLSHHVPPAEPLHQLFQCPTARIPDPLRHGPAASAISKSQACNVPREAFQRDRWLLLKDRGSSSSTYSLWRFREWCLFIIEEGFEGLA